MIFPVSIFAYREEQLPARIEGNSVIHITNKNASHTGCLVEAINKDEAYGKGTRIARKIYPSSSGWQGHHIAVGVTNVIDPEGDLSLSPA